jgi:protein AIR1/2
LNPDTVPLTSQDGQNTASVANEEKSLLPSHVTVLGSTPVEIVEFPLSVSKEEDFIKYLDYEDTKVCLL